MSSIVSSPARAGHVPPVSGVRVGVGVAVAAVASVVVNAVIATVVSSTDVAAVQVGLVFVQYAPLTVFGVLAGTAGWTATRRFARRPRAVLRVLVPAVLLISFVPDLLVLTAGATVLNVAGLLAMHIAVAAITVPLLNRVLPLPAPSTTS